MLEGDNIRNGMELRRLANGLVSHEGAEGGPPPIIKPQPSMSRNCISKLDSECLNFQITPHTKLNRAIKANASEVEALLRRHRRQEGARHERSTPTSGDLLGLLMESQRRGNETGGKPPDQIHGPWSGVLSPAWFRFRRTPPACCTVDHGRSEHATRVAGPRPGRRSSVSRQNQRTWTGNKPAEARDHELYEVLRLYPGEQLDRQTKQGTEPSWGVNAPS
ncbi:hypothetical protein PR202_gb05458 [Eleusine coracana subsp. coracana]|uniref:Uncharacterized protein n=1 Tax=Eleusine coracana subsp. coracana TaxID=191504 RepID=A0AAV5E7Y2_ELECO|nr:hypothetical protein PR202_gb05458 [Eleusine coracana subsp. coracana]